MATRTTCARFTSTLSGKCSWRAAPQPILPGYGPYSTKWTSCSPFASRLQGVGPTNTRNTQKAHPASGRSGSGPATADPHAESSDGQQQVEKMKAVLQAHAGDPQWLMSPEGQGVIAQMQSAATGM